MQDHVGHLGVAAREACVPAFDVLLVGAVAAGIMAPLGEESAGGLLAAGAAVGEPGGVGRRMAALEHGLLDRAAGAEGQHGERNGEPASTPAEHACVPWTVGG